MKIIMKLLILGLVLVGCSSAVSVETDEPGVAEAQILPKEEMEMLISKVDETTIEYVMINHLPKSYTYGEMFTIEIYQNGTWQNVKMKDGVGFHAIGYVLKPLENVVGDFDYPFYFTNLPKGQYRLVKALFNEDHELRFVVGLFSMD
ncbi:MAG TPA: hypothetical protein GX741_01030 [Erysipelothrix sp.]|nr:hypothetical protein [Erysipelothrix sp.]